MAAKTRPVQRTKAYYKAQGIHCEVVEKWVPMRKHPGGGFRKDLLDIIDILAFDGEMTIGIQCCSGSGHSSHIEKLMVEKKEKTLIWLESPYRRLELHAWRQLKKVKGKKAMHWVPRITVIDLTDFE